MHETSAPVRPSLRCDTLEAVRLPAAEAMFGATIRASAASMNSLRVIACRLADSMPERSHPGVSRARSSWPSSTQDGPRSDSESPETVLALSRRHEATQREGNCVLFQWQAAAPGTDCKRSSIPAWSMDLGGGQILGALAGRGAGPRPVSPGEGGQPPVQRAPDRF